MQCWFTVELCIKRYSYKQQQKFKLLVTDKNVTFDGLKKRKKMLDLNKSLS
jgi:hypothetical protein